MHIELKNLGPLRQAEFSLGDLTIICGSNNTGKTYATYALYGFLEYWEKAFVLSSDKKSLDELYSNGKAIVPLEFYAERASEYLKEASKEYSAELSEIFASEKKYFRDSTFVASASEEAKTLSEQQQVTIRSRDKDVFRIEQIDTQHLELTLLVDKESSNMLPPSYVLEHRISEVVKKALFSNLVPRAFISSAERTGAAIFRKELDLARNRALDLVSDKSSKFNPIKLLQNYTSDYALPVRNSVEFTRQLGDLTKRESDLKLHAPDLLNDFSEIIGGEYKVIKDELFYIPEDRKGVRLTMGESSSSVRSLLDIGFYLRHVAQRGDLLMIDEPELNLHPQNQRRVARLLASLVNHGIKVFITTHSDYIIKELNTLIMLFHRKASLCGFMKSEGYREYELIDPNRIKVYIAGKKKRQIDDAKKKCNVFTLTNADVDESLGIEAESFDKTINEMNRIQDEILFPDGVVDK